MNYEPFLKPALLILCKLIKLFRRKKPVMDAPTFLIVEDNDNDAFLLEHYIAKKGFKVEIANSAETAEGLVRHSFYPCIFVDLRLPGMSGEALLRILSEKHPSAHAVVVCGEPSDLKAIPHSTFLSGVIVKPITAESLNQMFAKLRF